MLCDKMWVRKNDQGKRPSEDSREALYLGAGREEHCFTQWV